jgi:hypothetical protein
MIRRVACGVRHLVLLGIGALGLPTCNQSGASSPDCTDQLSANASSPDARQPVASIHVTLSTNSSEIDVVAFDDGSPNELWARLATVAIPASIPRPSPTHRARPRC